MAARPTIAIIGAGQMGSALGSRCVTRGARVITPLSGRSEATLKRARDAGMEGCGVEDLREARLILSVVPPARAAGVADMLAPVLGRVGPTFIDANALSPKSKLLIAEQVAAAGGSFVDGVIIGGPPEGDLPGPRIYLCGEASADAEMLGEFGLDIRVLDGPIGTAAALKMCYGGLNKGLTALTTAVLLAAIRSGVARDLMDEWDISQQFIRDRSARAVPGMYPKAHRWIAEFEEVAEFAGPDGASAGIFQAIAHFFEERSESGTAVEELALLEQVLTRRKAET